MAPPTEHLIRDYLNRLSAAARGRLDPDDRHALVDRTREFIERKVGSGGPPTAMQVGTLLAGLGDPSTLVQQERQRLSSIRGALPEPSADRNPITKALRRDPAKSRRASWHWPAADGRTELQLNLPGSGGAGTSRENGSNGTGPVGSASHRVPMTSDESNPFVPAQPSDRDWFFRALGGGRMRSAVESDGARGIAGTDAELAALDPAGRSKPPWPLGAARGADSRRARAADRATARTGDQAPATVRPAWRLTIPRERRLLLRRAVSETAAWYRRRPLAASAVVLLGLGGAIYPPIWLLGAAVALPSRVWDGRDKWLGLAVPVLLTILAAALGVTTGGHGSVGHAVHEGWVYAVTGSRIAAVLGASYLGWRSARGPRPPAVPPWNRPHRVS